MSKTSLEVLKEAESVKRWFSLLRIRKSGSINTEKLYLSSLKKFCEFHKIKNPDTLIEQYKKVKYNLAEREKLTDKLGNMIDSFAIHMEARGKAKTSIATITTAVKSFFKWNKVDLKWTPIKASPETMDEVPTLEQLQRIVNHLSPKGYMRALIWFLAQSGLRLGTVLQLRYSSIKEDFEAERIPCRVVVPKELTKGKLLQHYSFIGKEAVDELRIYLNRRKRGSRYLPPERITDDSFLFRAGVKKEKPVLHGSVENEFRQVCLDLGLMKKSAYKKSSKIRVHTLRKFFRTYANGAGYTWVQFWMGHKLQNNDETYFHAPEVIEESRKAYASILRYISPSVAQTQNSRITELEEEVKRLRRIEREYQILKEKIGNVDNRLMQLMRMETIRHLVEGSLGQYIAQIVREELKKQEEKKSDID